MSASSSSNAEEKRRRAASICSGPSLPPVSANNTNPNRTRAFNPNFRPTSAAHTDCDQHYSMKLRSHAHSSSTPEISNIFDAATTSSTPDEVISRSDIVEARRQRSTIVSSEQISHCMAGTELVNSPRKRKSYPCLRCDKHFRSGQSLGGHMNSHRSANANPRQEVDQEAGGQSGPSSQPGVDNATIYRGVRHRKEQNKWVVEIRPPRDQRTVWLGTYESQLEAAYVYDAAICYFGTESPLNFGMHELYRNIRKVNPGLCGKKRAIEIREVIKEVSRQAMEEDRTQRQTAQTFNAGGGPPGLLVHHVDASIPSTGGSTPPAQIPGIAAPTGANVREEQHDEANASEDTVDLIYFPSLEDPDGYANYDHHPNL